MKWFLDKLGGDEPPLLLLVITLAVTLSICAFAYRVSAQAPQYWMRLDYGTRGFDCVTVFPYTRTQQMVWSETEGLTEVGSDYRTRELWIQVQSCNLIHVNADADGNLFALTFTDIEGMGAGRFAAHMDGAWWVVRSE